MHKLNLHSFAPLYRQKLWDESNLRTRNIEEANESEMRQREQLIETRMLISQKKEQLRNLRTDIAAIKGDDEEDDNFHIDRTRDSRGFTILIIAAMNNDLLTAQVCFDLGADPFVQGPDDLIATEYSYFFEYEDMTDLIIKVSIRILQPEQLFCFMNVI